jgi:hypothetical protein
MRWDFLSQPLAVSSAMVSRTGMMWFLLTCFAASDKKIRRSIIVCAIVQIVANMVTIVQIVVQCGPNPYYVVRELYRFALGILMMLRPIVCNTFNTCGLLYQRMDLSNANHQVFKQLLALCKEVRH